MCEVGAILSTFTDEETEPLASGAARIQTQILWLWRPAEILTILLLNHEPSKFHLVVEGCRILSVYSKTQNPVPPSPFSLPWP